MNFKRGLGKQSKPTAPRPVKSQPKGSNVTLSGFSFKQLEEDEEEEDLTSYTGKYEKVVEQSQTQRASRKDFERSTSLSSASSTSSGIEDYFKPEKSSSSGLSSMETSQSKMLSQSSDSSSSPLRTAARQKIETSRELFSGLKGRIAGKISKTIDEFTGDSTNSPEKERSKASTINVNDADDMDSIIVKEMVDVLHSASPEPIHVETDNSNGSVEHLSVLTKSSDAVSEVKDGNLKNEVCSITPVSASEGDHHDDSNMVPSSSTNTPTPSPKAVSIPDPPFSPLEPSVVEDHPLAKNDDDYDDGFEDVIESLSHGVKPLVEVPMFEPKSYTEDSSDYHDPHSSSVDASDILMFEEHFEGGKETSDGSPGFVTSTKLKSRSVIKRFGKKEPKTSAVATMSALHDKPDEELVSFADESKAERLGDHRLKDSKMPPTSLALPSAPVTPTVDVTPSSSLSMLPIDPRSMPYQKLIAIAVVLFAYLIVPLPSYMSGLIMGVLLTSIGWGIYMWLTAPPKPQEPLILPPLEEEPPVPQMKISTDSEEYTYKGWLNELTDYNVDDYHINKTHSVFISLEGSHLRIQRPKNPVPKRAMWDEKLPKPQFVHQRHFDLPGASVYLAPSGLVKKRIWSKKYPICIDLNLGAKPLGDNMKHVSSDPNMSDKKDKSHVHGFEIITGDKCDSNVLYLFARTGREKEDWFRRFAAAAQGTPLGNHVLEMKRVISPSSPTAVRKKREDSKDSLDSMVNVVSDSYTEQNQNQDQENDLLPFAHYMGRLMPAGSLSKASSPIHNGANNQVTKDSTEEPKVVTPRGAIICDGQLFWLNALIGRCFFDFLRDKWWIGKVMEKLQRKLSKIHVPYFIEELQVTDIHMGYEIPAIRNAGKPYIDERGFWVDLDITYSGGFTMTIETKMNLMKLKKSPHQSHSHGKVHENSHKSAITHSDEEDSAESSTDEEEEVPAAADDGSAGGGGGSGKKFFRYLNKITQSRYFQQATEYGVIKRAMENVSNTPLTLTVTVNSLVGKLALNIPPPRSDRLWYGFRSNPLLRLSAKPQVGERAVKITHVTEWIEKKLALEFQRVFVMPNMDDLVIPILVPGEVPGTGATTGLTHSVSL